MKSNLAAMSFALCCASLLPAAYAGAQGFPNQRPGMSPISANNSDPFGDSYGAARITGTVRTSDGHPVPNAEIQARDLERGTHFTSGRAGTNGAFALYNVPPGNYEVTATDGLSEARERVQVASGAGDANVDFRLAKPSAPAGSAPTISLSQYSVPAKARELYEKAAQYMTRNKLDQAREKVNAAIAIFPRFSEALALRGLLQEAAGNKDAALADYQQAIQFDAHYPVAYIAMASLLNSLGRFGDAKPLLETVERLAPKAWQTHFEMARANIGKGEYAQALKDIDHAIELQGGPQKELPEMHLVRGYALLGINEIPRAVQEIQTFLASQPKGQIAEAARKVLGQLNEQTITASR